MNTVCTLNGSVPKRLLWERSPARLVSGQRRPLRVGGRGGRPVSTAFWEAPTWPLSGPEQKTRADPCLNETSLELSHPREGNPTICKEQGGA